jgi:glycosyltransferase involved in cell wall biosynthesis
MRILMLHNRYRWPGGEERAVENVTGLLRRRGHEVRRLERSSTETTQARAAASLIWGGVRPEEVGGAVREMRADVVHAHNVHPLFGWRALAAAREAGAHTVLHLHNFRLFCAIAVAYRDGGPCFRCRGRDTRPGVRLRCRGSTEEAVAYGLGLHLQQPRLIGLSDRFITVSRTSAARLIELGLPADRARTLPNFLPADQFAERSEAGRGVHALVSGRLVEEKGVDTAILACRQAGVPLLVAGDGPDLARLKRLAGDGDVHFSGQLDPRALARERARAGVVLIPSRSEEACPFAALEALAAGVPVLATDLGSLPELVGAENVHPPADVDGWADWLATLWADPDARQVQGEEALERARMQFSEDRYHERLLEIYREAVASG